MRSIPYIGAVLLSDRASDVLLGVGAPPAAALIEGDRVVSHGQLGDAVARRAGELDLAARSLVVLEATNTIEFVVTYLALLDGGHVPLLAGAHRQLLATAWEADAVIGTSSDGWHLEHRGTTHDRELHPQLALLLSTSGSMGSPKLVRLSHRNVASNACAIADYLALTPADRGITSLPLHYCYGLSVLHSHLAAGAAVVMTPASVVDPCFTAALEAGVTNLAGVPHTFELLEQAGPDRVHVPTLRFMTQAGGKMGAERVRAWSERTASWGVDLFVMYGQTEATARIAYLPPELVDRHTGAIGRPIPGGRLELRPVDGAAEGVGEIVYRGPNVMLGYATEPDDLALGATIDELATGDLGRYDPEDDIFEIVGRRSRFVKPFGLRIDLDAVEAALTADGIAAVATGDDTHLVVGAPGRSPDEVRARLVALTGLPPSAVIVDTADVPYTEAGKVDHGALLRRSSIASPAEAARTSAAGIFASVLGRGDVGPDSTFVGLGGDSLSYVECSVLLEERLGRLPDDWHLRRVDELDALDRRVGRPRLDTTALLRAMGILFVVSTHMHLWYFPGGSHLLLGIVGYNASRFLFCIDGPGDRVAAVTRSIARLAVPVVAFVGVCMVLVGGYGTSTLTLVNGYLGPASHLQGRWHYWFIEVVVQVLLLTTILLAVGPVRRLERRFAYAFPLALLGLSLVVRELWTNDNLRFQAHGAAWFFVLGWLVHRSTTVPKKLLTTALCLATIPGFFGRPERELLIAAGLVLLVWCREVALPRLAIRPIAAVAGASMVIYLTHFRIWRVLDRNLPSRGWAYVATIVLGVTIWIVAERTARWIRLRRAARPVTTRPAAGPAVDQGAPRPAPADPRPAEPAPGILVAGR